MSGINIPITVTGADTAATQLGKVSTSLGGVGTSTDKANDALKNVGKTIKDIPGGFDAIGNNVKPLIQSFGGLVAETGSVGSAFGELALALAGPAGIGIAIAVATTAFKLLIESFTASEEGSSNLESSLKGLGVQFETTKKDAELFGQQLDAAAKLRTLNFEINIPDKRKRLDAILGFTLQDANVRLNELGKLQTDLQNQIGPIVELVNKEGSQQLQDLYRTTNDITQLRIKSTTFNEKDQKIIAQIVKNSDELNKVGNEINIAYKEREGITAQNVLDVRKLNEEEAKRAQQIQKQKAAADSVAKTLASLNEKLIVLGKEEDIFNVDKSKEKIKLLEGTITTLFSKFKLDPNNEIIQQLKRQIFQIEAEQGNGIILAIDVQADLKQTTDAFRELGKKNAPKIEPIKLPAEVTFDKIGDFAKKAQEFASQAGDIIGRSLGDAFSGIGEAIGNIITGKGGAGDLFGGIFKVLGDGLKTLGQFVIQSAILLDSVRNVLNSILSSPGGFVAGIALGIALITLGTVISNSIPGFANGVTNFGGGMALVGERGPELVRLPSGSDVIPNFRLNSLSASQPTAYIPNVTLRGSDLVIAFNRQTATNRRNG